MTGNGDRRPEGGGADGGRDRPHVPRRAGRWVRRALALVAVIGAAGGSMGCVGARVPDRSLYVLDHDAELLPRLPAPADPLPYRVLVRDLAIARIFDRHRIVYRTSPHEVNYYRFHLWAAPPRTMVSDRVARHLERARIFTEVARDFLDARPDLEVTGTIRAIEQVQRGLASSAHLAMRLELRDGTTGALIATHEFDRERPLTEPTLTALARTLSRILEEETATFLARIWTAYGVQADPPVVYGDPWSPEAVPSVAPEAGYEFVPFPHRVEGDEERGEP